MVEWLTSLLVLGALGVVGLPKSAGHFGLTAKEPLPTLSLKVEENHTSGRELLRTEVSKICGLLKLQGRQKRVCVRGYGVAEALVDTVRLSVLECEFQFRQERWNCSLGQHRLNLLEKGFKEVSFLYAVSSAALVHTLSRACSKGKLDLCTCDKSFREKHKNKEAWLWGGCGDNLKFGMKFTRNFLKSRRWNKDLRAMTDWHNSNVGIRVVKKGMEMACKCHGISGSCSIKTCWRQLQSFHATGETLKEKYEHATVVSFSTNQATGEIQLVKSRRKKVRSEMNSIIAKPASLVHIDKSPSFCRAGKYSSGTRGRYCEKSANCDVMCCGRGYNVGSRIVAKPCNCTVIWCCDVVCQKCFYEEELYTCK